MKIPHYTLCGLFLCVYAIVTPAEMRVRQGFAYAIDSGQILYKEIHNEHWAGDNLVTDSVEYLLPNGDVLAQKMVEYSASSLLPDFELKNLISGHSESARKIDNQYEVNFQKNSGASKKSARLDIGEHSVSDAGFDRMIEAHWSELIIGDTIKKQFLVPSMLRFITFRVYQDAVITAAETRFRRIIIEPDNLLLRLVADRIIVDYSFDEPILRRFNGVSNMRDADGNNYQVAIFFPDENIKLARLQQVLSTGRTYQGL